MDLSILKRPHEENFKLLFDDELGLNSKLEKFLMCETESYFNSHTYDDLRRLDSVSSRSVSINATFANEHVSMEVVGAIREELCFFVGPSQDVITETSLEVVCCVGACEEKTWLV
jgi:hypothetical protein